MKVRPGASQAVLYRISRLHRPLFPIGGAVGIAMRGLKLIMSGYAQELA